MGNQTAILQIHQVTKIIKGRTLIDQLSFQVPKGAICGLLGPNGAGKTTLIRMLTGLIQPTAGQLILAGEDSARRREHALRHAGAIVESPIFFPYLTGRGNLLNLIRLHPNIAKQERQQIVDEVLQIVGLTNRAEDKVRTYSLGMKQRLGIAQALLGDPDLLILDEPANGLDPMGIRELRELILRLNQVYGKTILVSSHLLDELQKICDQIVVLHEGKLLWNGALDQLAAPGQSLEDAFVELVTG